MHKVVSGLTTDLTEGEVQGMQHSSMSADCTKVSAIYHKEMANVIATQPVCAVLRTPPHLRPSPILLTAFRCFLTISGMLALLHKPPL